MKELTELEKEIRTLQHELAFAIGNSDLLRAHELELKIDELQKEFITLKQIVK